MDCARTLLDDEDGEQQCFPIHNRVIGSDPGYND
jgi:hypothetical protein